MNKDELLKIGTCSWKYDSWVGLIYSEKTKDRYLNEYGRHFSTVEIDQWFWSLFPESKVALPKSDVVQEYVASVPDDFKFSVKAPNSVTLTHYYTRSKNSSLTENPHFFSNELFNHRFGRSNFTWATDKIYL